MLSPTVDEKISDEIASATFPELRLTGVEILTVVV
jgi:hypothetical protein